MTTLRAFGWGVSLCAALFGCQRSPAPAASRTSAQPATPDPTPAAPPTASPKDHASLVAAQEEPAGEPSNTANERRVKEQLRQILHWVEAGDCAKLAPHVVFRGKDDARRWKDTYRYDVAAERAAVDGICRRIASIVKMGKPKYLGFESERESEGEWLVVSMRFGDGEKKRSFAFLDISGRLAIGDID